MDSSTNPMIIDEIEDARRLFSRLQAGDHKGFGTAKAMSEQIKSILKDVKEGFSVLSRDGKSNAEMELELKKATVKLQVADSIEMFGKLKAGDIHVSPVYMADRIRGDLADVGQKQDALDTKHKKSAQQMDQELTKHTTIQQLKIVLQNFADLGNGVITISPEHMERSIRKDLSDIGQDLSALNTNPKVKISNEEMDKKLKEIVVEQSGKLEKLNEAKAILELIEGKGLSASNRVKIDGMLKEMKPKPDGSKIEDGDISHKEWVGLIRKKMDESGKPLSALVEEKSSGEVKAILDAIVMKELGNKFKAGEDTAKTHDSNYKVVPPTPSLGLGFSR